MTSRQYSYKKAPDYKYFCFDSFWVTVNERGEVHLHFTEERAGHPVTVTEKGGSHSGGVVREVTSKMLESERVIHATGKMNIGQLPSLLGCLQQIAADYLMSVPQPGPNNVAGRVN